MEPKSSAARDAVVTLRGVGRSYATPTGELEALRHVDASFAAGEITAVVGSSGSGKSTLLRLLAGLDRPTGGELDSRGVDLAHGSGRVLRRHREHVATFINQRAAENFIPHLRLEDHAVVPEARKLLDEFGLSHVLGEFPAELSGGEQARAAFALALARRSALVVSDEPTAELDRTSAAALLQAIRDHAASGVAFVIATHDPDVMAIADTVLTLDRGRVIATQEPRQREVPAKGAVTGEVIVSASGLEKTYAHGGEPVHAVRSATLELRSHELAALIGRSGSGKSTLLALLAGLQTIDAGTLSGSLHLTDPPWSEVAFLPQKFGLLPELSVRENVQYPARLGGTLDERSPVVESLLEDFGLLELADRYPNETSIGQQQRTALARALVLEPTLLLADEPTSHQDAGWRDAVWERLAAAAAAGASCLIATHEDVADVVSVTWQMQEGVVEQLSDARS